MREEAADLPNAVGRSLQSIGFAITTTINNAVKTV